MIIFSPNTIAKSSEINANFVEVAGMPGEWRGWTGVTAPSGWLLCQGQAVSRVSYSILYAICGTKYGAGNGTTTFNLPDFGGNVPAGYKSGDANFGTHGAIVGAATANLSHSHTVNSHSHTGGNHAHGLGGHTHGYSSYQRSDYGQWQSGGSSDVQATHTGYAPPGHDHGITVSGTTGGPSGGSDLVDRDITTGGSSPGTNAQLSSTQSIIQPSQVTNFIIKY